MDKKKKLLQQTAGKLVTVTNPRSFVAEQFRTLRTNITFSSHDADIRTMVVTSALPSEGKSTTTINLAVVFAQEGKKVLIVDGDMRKPTVHTSFNIKNTTGLSSVLTRQSTAEKVICSSEVERLDLLTCGPIPPNPAELLSSKSMDVLIRQLKDLYDIVIFDSPPVNSVTDAQILANKCEGTIFVINSGHTEKGMALMAKEAIKSSNGRIIGAVLNNFKLTKDYSYYHYYDATQ
ncbi:CpsD/CapB family tyrosine-protein kinase [Planococcus sp. N028]|uniref:non-specific protein-tyrosine kinase n=1 Tax=Planococcus shixiaomingii TaxID=3058393 RepID=A0ABT8N1V0_9BACL|nr:CpsD/CapB family tyrosine-protein kinase [Planococcus sp. N028]MDN7241669.1 CpsD/CapB family tyrosine-protein kinase [Planococcus sp. N028]